MIHTLDFPTVVFAVQLVKRSFAHLPCIPVPLLDQQSHGTVVNFFAIVGNVVRVYSIIEMYVDNELAIHVFKELKRAGVARMKVVFARSG